MAGGTDINLVPQLGKLNFGQFRVPEKLVRKLAEENVRSLYFVRPIYFSSSQTPTYIEQAVIRSARTLDYALAPELVSEGRLDARSNADVIVYRIPANSDRWRL